MRRTIRTTGVAAAAFFLALGVASAADRDQVTPESRAYFGFSFGGHKVAPRDLHYGLRIDHDARFLETEMAPPLMQFDFTRRGLSDARFNGLSVLKQSYKLRQSEEQAAEEAGEAPAEPAPIEEGAPAEEGGMGGEGVAAEEEGFAAEEGVAAEEGGFFSNMWGGVTGFFGGLFGGGDEEEMAEEAALADEAPTEESAEEVADGAFMNFDVVDWGLLALGVVGVGLAASEVLGGDESLDLKDSDGDGISDDDDPTPNPPGEPCPIPGVPLPPGCIPFAGHAGGGASTVRLDPAYQEWLDGGAGQMGDLVAR